MRVKNRYFYNMCTAIYMPSSAADNFAATDDMRRNKSAVIATYMPPFCRDPSYAAGNICVPFNIVFHTYHPPIISAAKHMHCGGKKAYFMQ